MIDMLWVTRFIDAYIECALWSSNDESTPEGGEPIDANYGPDDLAPKCIFHTIQDCTAFIESNLADLSDMEAEQAGHDFWLTRNHHGAGFWDRGLGEIGDRLTKASHLYGSVTLYIGDDKKVHC